MIYKFERFHKMMPCAPASESPFHPSNISGLVAQFASNHSVLYGTGSKRPA